MQPVLTHVPPKSFRSMIATFCPAAARRRARGGPACPVPITIASKRFRMHRAVASGGPRRAATVRRQPRRGEGRADSGPFGSCLLARTRAELGASVSGNSGRRSRGRRGPSRAEFTSWNWKLSPRRRLRHRAFTCSPPRLARPGLISLRLGCRFRRVETISARLAAWAHTPVSTTRWVPQGCPYRFPPSSDAVMARPSS
jgi:hypothetical protein